ncbi:MAG: EpsG family protein [Methylobacter sp.]|nr:EpsG family protein [Methylobacter sp.]
MAGRTKESKLMLVYWLMFCIPALVSLYFPRKSNKKRDSILHAICILFVFFIGLRFEVGGDWLNYLNHYEDNINLTYSSFDGTSDWDPGYVLFEYVSALLGFGIYGVNLICGAVLMAGIYYFCRRQPQPFLALLVAVPYMIIIVGMGYSRQGVALGFELLAVMALVDGRVRHFILWVICAALLHKSAVLLFSLSALSLKDKSIRTIVVILTVAVSVSWELLHEHSEELWLNYVEERMESEGAMIRVIMNAVPAALFLIFAKRLAPDEQERKVWFWMALLSLACIPWVSSAPTAVDRVALYFLPIQLLVYSRLGNLFRLSAFRILSTVIVIVGYGVVLFVLLNYGTIITTAWIPYDNVAFFW